MNILIVDDDKLKIKEIISVIKGIGIEDLQYDYCLEVVDAKRSMMAKYYDLLILDVMLPDRIDGQINADGGIKLLKELRGKEKYKYPGIIIGITSDEDIVKKYKYEFFSIIHYDSEYFNWKDDLCNYISLAVDTITRLESRREVDYKYEIGIVCALNKRELTPIRESFGLTSKIKDDNDCLSYYEGIIDIGGNKVKVVATSSDEMGLTSTAVASMKLVERYRPKYLFMTGICAGVRGKVNFGDIIVADPIWNYGNGKYVGDGDEVEFLPDPHQLRINLDIANIIDDLKSDDNVMKEIKNKFDGTRPEHKLRCLKGAFASGEAVLATKKKIEDIKGQARNLLGIDMESYAVHYVGQYCTKMNPKVITLKSVCDFGDEEKGDEYQEYAAFTSASFLYKLVEKIFITEVED